MSAPRDTFVDATHGVPDVIAFPEVVADLEAAGFDRIGRLGRAVPGQLWRWAAAYPKAHRDEFTQRLGIPPVVLRAPDGTAFVAVLWWWGMPDVRFRTQLSDGSVVETLRAWDHSPPPPRAHRRIYRLGDHRQEQLLLNAPAGGRDVALAAGTPAELWRAHRDRVAQVVANRGVQVVAHADMAQALAMANRLARHHEACQRALKVRGASILLTILLVAVAVLFAIFTLPLAGKLVLLLLELAALFVLLAFKRRIRTAGFRRRYATSSRPALEPWSARDHG